MERGQSGLTIDVFRAFWYDNKKPFTPDADVKSEPRSGPEVKSGPRSEPRCEKRAKTALDSFKLFQQTVVSRSQNGKTALRKGEGNMESMVVRKKDKMQSTFVFITVSY